MLKYEITDVTDTQMKQAHRIRALRDIPQHSVKAGDMGGYICSLDNLSQDDYCWVGGSAIVHGEARIYDGVLITDEAIVEGNVTIYGTAIVSGKANVRGHVFNRVRIFDDVTLSDHMIVVGPAIIHNNSQIHYEHGITAYVNAGKEFVMNGISKENEMYATLLMLKFRNT